MKRIIRLPEVIDRTGLKRSSIYAAVKKGDFPSQIPLGERSVGWDESAINSWVEDRISAGGSPRNSKSSEVTK